MRRPTIRSAQTMIRIAAILRLLLTAVLALLLAHAYTDEQEDLFRLYRGADSLITIVCGFLLDTVLTIQWLYRPKLHTLHLVMYILLGGQLYMSYVIDLFNITGMAVLEAFLIAPVIWLFGLFPFILCGIGRKELTSATAGKGCEPEHSGKHD